MAFNKKLKAWVRYDGKNRVMTCNAGSPDADIAYLQANNTVTIITV